MKILLACPVAPPSASPTGAERSYETAAAEELMQLRRDVRAADRQKRTQAASNVGNLTNSVG
jgi:hypothetical protein